MTSAYDKQGWVAITPCKVISDTAQANKDATYTISFNCDDNAINNINVKENWNALLRFYVPTGKQEFLSFVDDLRKDSPVTPVKK